MTQYSEEEGEEEEGKGLKSRSLVAAVVNMSHHSLALSSLHTEDSGVLVRNENAPPAGLKRPGAII